RHTLHLRFEGDKRFDVQNLTFAIVRIFLAGYAFAFLAADNAEARSVEDHVTRPTQAIEVAFEMRDRYGKERGHAELADCRPGEMPHVLLDRRCAALQSRQLPLQ